MSADRFSAPPHGFNVFSPFLIFAVARNLPIYTY
jgi:hypothetical protein